MYAAELNILRFSIGVVNTMDKMPKMRFTTTVREDMAVVEVLEEHAEVRTKLRRKSTLATPDGSSRKKRKKCVTRLQLISKALNGNNARVKCPIAVTDDVEGHIVGATLFGGTHSLDATPWQLTLDTSYD